MKKDQPLLNPNLKSALVNLDLELESELNRYESSQKSLPSNNIATSADAEWTNINTNNSQTEGVIELPVNNQESEIIPVAYRVILDQKSLLDKILTPWGVFAIVLFVLANGMIFVHFFQKPEIVAVVDSDKPTTPEIVTNEKDKDTDELTSLTQQSPSETHNTPMPTKEQINQFPSQNVSPINQNISPTTTNIPNSIPSPPSPPLPPPLTTLETNPSTSTIAINQQPKPYPNLVTALLSNSPNQVKNNPPIQKPSPSRPIASPLPPPPPPSMTNNLNSVTPNNSESVVKQLQYYVLTDYNGIQSFEDIQTIYPHALITNIGKDMKIQLGVFDNQNEANKLIENLKTKQVVAYLYTLPLQLQ